MSILYTYFSRVFCCVEADSATAYLSESDVEDYYMQREQQAFTARSVLTPIPPVSAADTTRRSAFSSSHQTNHGDDMPTHQHCKPPSGDIDYGGDDGGEGNGDGGPITALHSQKDEGGIVFDIQRVQSLSTPSISLSPTVSKTSLMPAVPPPAAAAASTVAPPVREEESLSAAATNQTQTIYIDDVMAHPITSSHAVSTSAKADRMSTKQQEILSSTTTTTTIPVTKEGARRTNEDLEEIPESEGTRRVLAGSTMSMFPRPHPSPTEPVNDSEVVAAAAAAEKSSSVQNTWSSCPSASFLLRVGPNYNKHKRKEPSAPALYEVVGVDFFKCERRLDNLTANLSLPEQWTSVPTHGTSIPAVIALNAQFPSDLSSSFFSEVSDGDGWSIVYYFKLTQASSDAIANMETASPALKLLERYFKSNAQLDPSESSTGNESSANISPADPSGSAGTSSSAKPKRSSFFTSKKDKGNKSDTAAVSAERLKVSVRCENIDNFGLPSFITSYNSKPVLLRKNLSLHRGSFGGSNRTDRADYTNSSNNNTLNSSGDCGDDESSSLSLSKKKSIASSPQCSSYVEMDINIHQFASVAKKGLDVMFNKLDQMIVSTGFCIESRTEEEMPEVLIGCATIVKPSHYMALSAPRAWLSHRRNSNSEEAVEKNSGSASVGAAAEAAAGRRSSSNSSR